MPPPPIPAGANLADFPFMPLQVARLRGSKAWLICKRRPDLAFYMINLWTAAWHQLPAGSLEDDDDVLADKAMCAPEKWDKLREAVLRGWVRCSDGRLYHPVVAELVLDALQSKEAFRKKTLAARIGSLEGRIGRATSDGAKSRMRQELQVLQQEMSQIQSQNLSQKPDAKKIALSLSASSSVTEDKVKGREGKGEVRENSIPVTEQTLSQSGKRTEAYSAGDAIDPDRDPQNHAAWLEVRAAYPPHIHPEADWLIAERDASMRVVEGDATWSELKAGCERLHRQQIAKGNVAGESANEYVPSPKSMFTRREKRWREPYPLPAKKADQRLASNLSAAEEFMRRTETGT